MKLLSEIIFRITEEFIDTNDKNIKQELSKKNREAYIKFIDEIFDLLNVEYSFIIILIIIIQKVVKKYNISKNNGDLNYLFIICTCLAHKYINDCSIYLLDMIRMLDDSNLNIDRNKCFEIENMFFNNIYIDNNYKWLELYHVYDKIFIKYLNFALTEKNALNIIKKKYKNYKNYKNTLLNKQEPERINENNKRIKIYS